MATNVNLALIGLVTGILAARLLGPHGRGELAAIQLWPSFIAIVAMLGLPDSLVYHSSRNPEFAGRYAVSTVVFALVASVPFVLLGYGLLPVLLAAQSEDVINAARWYLLFVPVFALVGIPQSSLRGRSDFVAWNGLRITPAVAWLGVLLVAWTLGWSKAEPLAGSYLVALALLLFPVMYVVSRRVPGPFDPDLRTWSPMLRFGIPSMVSNIPQIINIRLDQMLVAALLPPQTLGLYVVAVACSGAAHPLISAFGSVIFPRVASQASELRQSQLFAQTSRLSVAGALGTAGTLILLTPFALPLLFGREFSAAVPAALILVVAGAAASINLVLEEGLRGLGVPTAVLKAELIGLAVTGTALAALLQPFGITGAALASLLGQVTVSGVLWLQGRQFTGNSIGALLRPSGSEIRYAWKRVQTMVREARTPKDEAH